MRVLKSFRLRSLSWIVTVPLALVAISFAVSNLQPVQLSLWPFPIYFSAPAFALVLVTLVVGFAAGGFIAWVGGHHHRAALKAERQLVQRLEAELGAMKSGGAAPTNRP